MLDDNVGHLNKACEGRSGAEAGSKYERNALLYRRGKEGPV